MQVRSGKPTSRPHLSAVGFFCLRTPLLPFDTLVGWAEGVHAPRATAEALAGALREDVRLLRARLEALVEHPVVREAIAVGSPSLETGLPTWLASPESERGQRVERALVRYVTRMASRATPFGLFAGISVGVTGPRTRLELADRAAYRHQTRLDVDLLADVAAALGRDPRVRSAASYRPSSGLYRAADRLRYAEARGDRRSHHLVSVEPSEALCATLARARDGAQLDALAVALVDEEITHEEARGFVEALVDAQILVCDLEPCLTGSHPVDELIMQLEGHAATRALAAPLARARNAMTGFDAAAVGEGAEAYRSSIAAASPLGGASPGANLLHVDLQKPVTEAALGPDVASELVRGVELLRRLCEPLRHEGLARFREAFASRYEERFVPLLEALDEDTGVGFESADTPATSGAPLLADLPLGSARADEVAVRWGSRHRARLRLLGEAIGRGKGEVTLDEAALEALEHADPPALPFSLYALATVATASGAPGDHDVYLWGAAGPSAANLLARFCHGSPELLEHVRTHLAAEEAARPEATFAEIVHLAERRSGGLVVRPLLRRWELPFLGRSGAPRERQLALDDLLVGLAGGRVVLRSGSLGREVIPRLSTAHAFSAPRNLTTYRFLCALSAQDACALSFSWGPLGDAPFLPRVRAGRLVLSLARWRLFADELAALEAPDAAGRFARVQALRARRGLPRWIAVDGEEQGACVDLDNALAIEAFVHELRGRPSVQLSEVFAPDRLCALGPEGRFCHELVVPLTCQHAPPPAQPVPVRSVQRTDSAVLARVLPPGSEWLYAKLYTGPALADRVLEEVVGPLADRVLASGAANRWFFVRYADPDFHLRVRFHGAPRRLTAEVMPALQEAVATALAAGTVWRLQLDTYTREVERYGGDAGMPLCEELFHADSDAVLALLPHVAGDAGAEARWRLALLGLDALLDDLGFDHDRRRALASRCRAGFAREFTLTPIAERALGRRFRQERLGLEALLAGERTGDLEPAIAVLRARSRHMRPVVARLRAAIGDAAVEAIAPSLLHMHANRLLRSAARAQELVLHDFLGRLYDGQSARSRLRPSEERAS